MAALRASLSVAKFQSQPAKLAFSGRRTVSVRGSLDDKSNVPPSVADTPGLPPPAVAQATNPSAKPETKFWDLMAFTGPGPELINGRLAMVGFVTAMAVEIATGSRLTSQISSGANISWALFAVGLFTAASLVPLSKGISSEMKQGKVFNSNAELINGRAAMLGLVALAITEFVTGSAVF
jgi:hypothetical protein